MSGQGESAGTGRVTAVILALVLGVSLVGFAVGIRPAARPAVAPELGSEMAVSAEVVNSRPYRALREVGRFGAGDRHSGDLANLRGSFPGLTDAVERSAEAKVVALLQRRERRAFDGAPPMIPHPVEQGGSAGDCLACHADGLKVAGKTAPVMSHSTLVSCTQCHVSAEPDITMAALPGGNSFVGMASPGAGPRAWLGAPPRIPHKTWMREDCASCHGLTGKPGLRTTHPERGSCTQCHAANQGTLPWGRFLPFYLGLQLSEIVDF